MEHTHPLPAENAMEHGIAQTSSLNLKVATRKAYRTPSLTMHGRFERMTLQTSGTGNSQTGDDGNST